MGLFSGNQNVIHLVQRIVLVAGVFFFSISSATAQRVALVVGNSEYVADVGRLSNPVNDAFAMATKLRQAGFTVIYRTDQSRRQMQEALDQFQAELRGADLGLFFFAGHGFQVEDQNYLLMTNTGRWSQEIVDEYALEVEAVQRLMEAEATASVLLIDACRNNPLMGESVQVADESGRTRTVEVGIGLAGARASAGPDASTTSRPVNSIVAFSASTGQLAYDGQDATNSPFASAILRHLFSPRLDLRILLARVTQDVISATRGSQQPQVFSQLASEVSLVDGVPNIPKPDGLPTGGSALYERSSWYSSSSTSGLPPMDIPPDNCLPIGTNTIAYVEDLDWFESRAVTAIVEALMASRTTGIESGQAQGSAIELEGASASQFHHSARILGEPTVGSQKLRVVFGVSYAYGKFGSGGPERAVTVLEFRKAELQTYWEIVSAGWGVAHLYSPPESDGDPRIIWVDQHTYAIEFPSVQAVGSDRQEQIFLYFVPMSGCFKTFEAKSRREFLDAVTKWLRSG